MAIDIVMLDLECFQRGVEYFIMTPLPWTRERVEHLDDSNKIHSSQFAFGAERVKIIDPFKLLAQRPSGEDGVRLGHILRVNTLLHEVLCWGNTSKQTKLSRFRSNARKMWCA